MGKDKTKDKAPKADKVKEKAPKPDKALATVSIDRTLVNKMLDTAKKWGNKDGDIDLFVTPKQIEMSMLHSSGRVKLTSRTALTQAGGEGSFRLPVVILASALSRNVDMTLSIGDTAIKFMGKGYESVLNVEPAHVSEVKNENPLDAAPITALFKSYPSMMKMNDAITVEPLDISVSWKGTAVEASCASQNHGLFVSLNLPSFDEDGNVKESKGKKGKEENLDSASVIIPSALAKHLSMVTGTFGLTDKVVSLSSQLDGFKAMAEFKRPTVSDTLVSLSLIKKMLEVPATGSVDVDAKELGEVVSAIASVAEWGHNLKIEVGKSEIWLSQSGRYGKTRASVKVHNSSGLKSAALFAVEVSPTNLTEVLAAFSKPITIEFTPKFIRISEIENKAAYGFTFAASS
jgi:hypothetical protein